MSEQSVQLIRTDPHRLHIERIGQMVTSATIFASESIILEPQAIRQLCDAASLPPAKKVLATADIHVGFGVPIGAVLGMDSAIMPAAVGYDINCGMRLLRTPFSKAVSMLIKSPFLSPEIFRSEKENQTSHWTESGSRPLLIRA